MTRADSSSCPLVDSFVSGAEVSEEKNAQLLAQLLALGLSLDDRGETQVPGAHFLT